MAVNVPSYRGQSSAPGAFAGVGRFLRWWGRELAALIPKEVRPLPRPTTAFLWVEVVRQTLILSRHNRAGKLEEIDRIDLQALDAPARKLTFDAALRKFRRLPIGLCIPASQVLRRQVTLPMAAKDNLRQVIGFELNRHTPFQAERAYFDYRQTGEDTKSGSLDVQLTVTPRSSADEGLAILRSWHRPPQAIVAADELVGGGHYANLLPPEWRPGIGPTRKLLYAGMALLSILLIVAALAVPLWQKREVAIALDEQAHRAKQRAAVIDTLRQDLGKVSAEYLFLLEKKRQRPAAVVLLEEVTRLLPDDTWLSQLEIKSGEVVISGATNSSASLIRLLEKSTFLEDATYRSPLVKGRDSGERFQLATRIKSSFEVDMPAAPVGAAEAKASRPDARPAAKAATDSAAAGKGGRS